MESNEVVTRSKTSHVCETRRDKDDPFPVRTELEIDWTDCDVTTYRAFAVQAITIKRQSVWRKSVIPPVERVVARELAPGLRVASKPTVEGIVAEAKTLSREDRAALLEKLKAESDEE